jgi:hypothetical protein
VNWSSPILKTIVGGLAALIVAIFQLEFQNINSHAIEAKQQAVAARHAANQAASSAASVIPAGGIVSTTGSPSVPVQIKDRPYSCLPVTIVWVCVPGVSSQ